MVEVGVIQLSSSYLGTSGNNSKIYLPFKNVSISGSYPDMHITFVLHRPSAVGILCHVYTG